MSPKSKKHHQRKIGGLSREFTAIFGVISYIIIGKTEGSENVKASQSVESSLCYKKGVI